MWRCVEVAVLLECLDVSLHVICQIMSQDQHLAGKLTSSICGLIGIVTVIRVGEHDALDVA